MEGLLQIAPARGAAKTTFFSEELASKSKLPLKI